MVRNIAGYDFAILHTPDGQDWAKHIIKDDGWLAPDDRSSLSRAVEEPRMFEEFGFVAARFLEVLSRSSSIAAKKYAAMVTSAWPFGQEAISYLHQRGWTNWAVRSLQPAVLDAASAERGYNCLTMAAAARTVPFSVLHLNEELIFNLHSRVQALSSPSATLAAMMDLGHRRFVMGDAEGVTHDALLREFERSFGKALPDLLYLIVSGTPDRNAVRVELPRGAITVSGIPSDWAETQSLVNEAFGSYKPNVMGFGDTVEYQFPVEDLPLDLQPAVAVSNDTFVGAAPAFMPMPAAAATAAFAI